MLNVLLHISEQPDQVPTQSWFFKAGRAKRKVAAKAIPIKARILTQSPTFFLLQLQEVLASGPSDSRLYLITLALTSYF